MSVVSAELVAAVRRGFALEWRGIHGVWHWTRVRENGLCLAEMTGANCEVVELFAVLHDSKRANDRRDPGHGQRAAAFIKSLRGTLIVVDDAAFEQLIYACAFHTDGLVEADVTVQTCWDADRLDLGRVNIAPQAEYLCTAPAKEPALIAWAYRRSRQEPPDGLPEWIGPS